LFANNLVYDIDGFTYNADGPSATGGHVQVNQGCQDLAIRNNTFGSNIGQNASQITIVRGQMEGFAFTDNIAYLNFGWWGGIILDGDNPSPSHPYAPYPQSGTYQHILETSSVRASAVVEPNYTFTNNLIVGGVTGSSLATVRDLTGAEVATYAAQYPAGNLFVTADTKAAREAQVGFTNAAANNYTLLASSPYINKASNGKALGVAMDALESSGGQVSGVQVTVGSGSAVVQYTAPDTRACSVDVSADGFATVTRYVDGGGSGERDAGGGDVARRTNAAVHGEHSGDVVVIGRRGGTDLGSGVIHGPSHDQRGSDGDGYSHQHG
jgi:hypothetical protein